MRLSLVSSRVAVLERTRLWQIGRSDVSGCLATWPYQLRTSASLSEQYRCKAERWRRRLCTTYYANNRIEFKHVQFTMHQTAKVGTARSPALDRFPTFGVEMVQKCFCLQRSVYVNTGGFSESHDSRPLTDSHTSLLNHAVHSSQISHRWGI